MKKTALALLLAGLCFGETTAQAKDWENTPSAEVKQAAEQGDADAQVALGWLYYDGKGVAQDYCVFRRS